MKFYLRVLLLSLLVPLVFSINGCSGGGGSGGGSAKSNAITRTTSFSIVLSSVGGRHTNSVNVFDYTLSIKRGTIELMDKYKDYISIHKNGDGSIFLELKQVTKDSKSEGLASLKVGDIITFTAKGYTTQQFVVTQDMLNNAGATVALKAIESRQTYALADMTNGSSSVAPRHAFGASTKATEDSVIFQTSNKQTTLILPKATYHRLVRKISRLPRSGTRTQVHLDMTSIDPRTEHTATIGNFSYDPSAEPENERGTNAATDDAQNSALESVVMADLKMTTDAGDEIHCFGDGTFDPQTNKCSDGETATLKMKIPESQFQQYATKYNDGDRVVPLYSYNKFKATWMRQLDENGEGRDGELVLEDNDNNGKANVGDALYIEGQVGHFSWWNGDWPTSRTCLNVNVDLTNNIGVSHILVKGLDYSGREFKRYINDTNISVIKDIPAKENSIVSVALIMSDGSIGDSTTHATGARASTCENVEKTLVAPLMHKQTLNVSVTDLNDKPLKDARIHFKGKSYYTDNTGKVDITTAYQYDYNATIDVRYYTNSFQVNDSKNINQSTINVVFKLDVAQTTFTGKVKESVNSVLSDAANAHITIYGNGFSQYATTDANGKFNVKLPTTKLKSNPNISIYIYKYNSEYAFYPTYREERKLDINNTDLGTFTLAFTTHKVTGRVTDTLNNGLSNVNVYSEGNTYRSTRTDENGYYELTLHGPKDVNTSIRAYTWTDRWLYSDTKYITTAINGKSEVNLQIELRKATIKGTVLSSKGVALENMYVYWSKGYWSYTRTDKDGNFELQTYNDGNGFLRVYNPNSGKYLNFSKTRANEKDIPVNGVKIGEITDAGNLQAVEENFSPVITGITVSPENPLADVPFAIDINAYDPDGDSLTYKLEQRYGSDATIVENNSTMLVTASHGYLYFKATVTDEYGNSTTKYLSSWVKDHVRPVIDSVNISYPKGLSYFDKSEDLNISVMAHSDEGNSLSYEFKLKNLTTDAETTIPSMDGNATLSSNLVDNGRYRLAITVKDLYKSTSIYKYITVDDTVAPVIDTLTLNGTPIKDGKALYIKSGTKVDFDINLTAETAGQKDLTWYWYIKGESSTEKTKEAVTFDKTGFYYGYVQVRDNRWRSDSRYFYISVAENQKPVIHSISITPNHIVKNSDSNYTDGNDNTIADMTFVVDATDSDDANLDYTFSNIDLDKSTDAIADSDTNSTDNKAKYNLNGLTLGKHAIKVTVSDGVNSVEKYKTFTILENKPPKITSMIVPVKVKALNTIQLRVSAKDLDSDKTPTYKWEILGTKNGSITNANSAFATYTAPNTATEKDVKIQLTVSDGVNKVVRIAKIKVLNNQAPQILYFDATPLSMTTADTTITLKARYGDVDGNIKSATYLLKDSSGSLISSFDAESSDALQSQNLDITKIGAYTLTLVVVDNDDANATEKLNIKVTKQNSAPIITSLTSNKVSLLRNEKATLNVVASDPDGDAISVEWSVTPSATLTTNKDKATFSAASLGTYTVTAIVTDAHGLKTSKKVTLNVVDTTLNLTASKTSVKTGESVTMTAAFSDKHTVPSDTKWSFVKKPSTSSSSLTPNGPTATFTPDVVGTYKVQAIATLNNVDYNSSTMSISATDSSTVTPDIEGVVTSSETEDSLSGVAVRLYNSTDSTLYDQTTTTDSTGKYSFSDVPSGTYYLVIYAGNDYITQTKVITVKK